MRRLGDEIRQVVSAVNVQWDELRSQTAYGQVRATLQRQRHLRSVAMVGLVCGSLLMGGAVAHWLHQPPPTTTLSASAAADAPLLKLSDGSRVLALEPRTVVETLELTQSRITMNLVSGRAEFDVTPNRQRVFRVLAGDVLVEVMGTRFSMERVGQGARVAVAEGSVRVFSNNKEQVLGAGEQAELPVPEVAASASAKRPSAPREAAAAPPPAKPGWRELAKDSNFQQAQEALDHAGASDIRQNPDDLLLAADVLRLNGHPEQAVPLLRAVVSQYPRDPRSPLAAFTLGRVLLDSLGQPREAASAFRQAQTLAPMGVLAEDALAREIEALSRAADTAQAQERAETYLKKYPTGSKVRAVRMYGGL